MTRMDTSDVRTPTLLHWPELVLAGVGLVVGAGSGALGSYFYYNDPWRPLAHTFGLWILVTVCLAAGRSVRHGVVAATTALVAAVLAFHLGRDVIYGMRYAGMPYEINADTLMLWIVLALVAGPLLGSWLVAQERGVGRRSGDSCRGRIIGRGLLPENAVLLRGRRVGNVHGDRRRGRGRVSAPRVAAGRADRRDAGAVDRTRSSRGVGPGSHRRVGL